MVSNIPMATDNNRTQRINHEIQAIRDLGYLCNLQPEIQGHAHYVIVQLQRETMEGPQPVMLYMRLGVAFPCSAPDIVVTVMAPSMRGPQTAYPDAVEELRLVLDSQVSISWTAENHLYEIVQEIQDHVQGDNLRIVTDTFIFPIPTGISGSTEKSTISMHKSDFNNESNQESQFLSILTERNDIPTLAPPMPDSRVQQLPVIPALPAQSRSEILNNLQTRTRSAKSIIVAVFFSFTVVIVGIFSALYFVIFYDPCINDLQHAQRDLLLDDPETLHEAVVTLETLRLRGQQGERGSCAKLVTDYEPLYVAYLRYGQHAFANDALDEAEESYQKALQLVPDSTLAQEGLDAVELARTMPLWEEVTDLWKVDTQESWQQVVSFLEQIAAIDPEAIDTTDGVSVTLKLYFAHIGWGDHLFANKLSEAKEHYGMARSLLTKHPVVEERIAWVDRAQTLQREDASTLATLVEEINYLAMEQPDLEDPVGNSIKQWLYKVHVAYGTALLHQSDESDDASIDAASFQAKKAMALALESDDNGESARLLQKRAERMLTERQNQVRTFA